MGNIVSLCITLHMVTVWGKSLDELRLRGSVYRKKILVSSVLKEMVTQGDLSEEAASALLPNIDQMQLGIDITKANAEEGIANPGTTRKLFDFKYSTTNPCLSADGLLIPDALCTSYQKLYSTTVLNAVDYAYAYEDIQLALYVENSFEKSLSIGDYNVEVMNLFGRSSKSFQLNAEFMAEQESVVVTSRAYTESYHVEMSKYFSPDNLDLISLNQEFVLDFKKLPTVYEGNEKLYYEFLAYWGGFYQSKLTMGAKYSVVSKFTKVDFDAMVAEGMDVEVTASLSTWSSATTKSGGGSEDASVQKFNSKAVGDQTIVSYGPSPPSTDSTLWWAVAAANPAPLFNWLSPITDFMTKEWIDDPDVAFKQINVARAIADMCQFAGCFNPTPPPKVLWTDAVTVSRGSTKQLTMANDSLCILSTVKHTTFQTCHLYLQQGVGETNYYWMLVASGDSGDIGCAAICSTSGTVSWAGIKNTALSTYKITAGQGEDVIRSTALSKESVKTRHCMPSYVENHVGCYDVCKLTYGDTYTLGMETSDPWDSKHAYLNSVTRACGATCFDVTSPKILYKTVTFTSDQSAVTLAPTSDYICMFDSIKGTGDCNNGNDGGGCQLVQKEVSGVVGDQWVGQAYHTTTGDIHCTGVCQVSCYNL